MPARNDRMAPIFDSQAPRELRRYFTDLDFLLSRSCITDDTGKKLHTTRYLAFDDQELWESVPEFSDPSVSFDQFTTAIFRLYPEADPDRRYSIADIDALVAEHSRITPPSRASFLQFYRRFFLISTYLCAKDRISAHEQSRAFVRAIPTSISSRVLERLRIRCTDVHPHDPYPLPDLRDAVDFVLLDSASISLRASPAASVPAPPEPPASAPSDPLLAPLVAAVNELVLLISSQQQPSRIAPHLDSLPPSSRLTSCSYCDSPAHFIARCPRVAEDVATGLCRRNSEGKVVLPSGSFVPRRVVGPNLRARIISWH
ncbi:hypothetical protein DFH08DRAFT_627542, partial [Mycena albidolilacea]